MTRRGLSFPDQLHQNPFSAPPIKLTVKNLFPGPKIETPLRDRDHDLAAHDLTFEVRIAIVLPGLIVAIPTERLMGGKFFQPVLKIPMESPFIVINEDRGGDMHGIYEGETLLDTTFMETTIDVLGDVDKTHAFGGLKPKFFAEAFHDLGGKADSSSSILPVGRAPGGPTLRRLLGDLWALYPPPCAL